MTYINSWSIRGSATAVNTLSLTVAPSNGNNLHIWVGFTTGTSSEVANITDNVTGNSYPIVDNLIDGSNAYMWQSAYGLNIVNSPTAIIATWTTLGGFPAILVSEHSGEATSSALDGHIMARQASPTTGANAVTSGNITTTASGDTIEGGCVDLGGGGSITAGTSPLSYAQRQYITNAFMVETAIQSAAGLLTNGATFTAGLNEPFTTGVMAFRPFSGITRVYNWRLNVNI